MASSVPFYAIDVAGLVLAVIGDNAKEAARLKTNPVVDPALPASVMRNDVLSPLFRPLVGTEKSIVERYLTKEAGPQNHDHAVPMLLALTSRMMIAPSRIPTIHGLGWGAFARHEIPAGTVLGLYGGSLVSDTLRDKSHLHDKVPLDSILAQRPVATDPMPSCFDYQWKLAITGRPYASTIKANPALRALLDKKRGPALYLLGAHASNQLAFLNSWPANLHLAGMGNNVVAAKVVWRNCVRVVYYTTRDIRAGAELFVSYGTKDSSFLISKEARAQVDALLAKGETNLFDWPIGFREEAEATSTPHEAALRAVWERAEKLTGSLTQKDEEEGSEESSSETRETLRRFVRAHVGNLTPGEQRSLASDEDSELDQLSADVSEAREHLAVEAIAIEAEPPAAHTFTGPVPSPAMADMYRKGYEAAMKVASERARHALLGASTELTRIQHDTDVLRATHEYRAQVRAFRDVRNARGHVIKTEALVMRADGAQEWLPLETVYTQWADRSLATDVHPDTPKRIVDYERDTSVLSRVIPPDLRFLLEFEDGGREWQALESFLDADEGWRYDALLEEYLDFLKKTQRAAGYPASVPSYDALNEEVEKRVAYLRDKTRSMRK
jgi:hypothetical protein